MQCRVAVEPRPQERPLEGAGGDAYLGQHLRSLLQCVLQMRAPHLLRSQAPGRLMTQRLGQMSGGHKVRVDDAADAVVAGLDKQPLQSGVAGRGTHGFEPGEEQIGVFGQRAEERRHERDGGAQR